MKTNKRRTTGRLISSLVPLVLFMTVMLGAVSGVRAQWTGTTDISNTNPGNVGIGTTSPQALLNIHSAAADGTSVQLAITGGVSGSRDLDFRGVHVSSDGSNKILGRIRLTNDGSYAQSGELGFFTGQNDGANNITLNERIRIKSNGNVGIGTTSPGEMLSLNGGALGAYYYSPGYGIRGIFNHSGNGSGILSAGGLQIASQGTNNATNGSGDINFFVTSSNSTGAFTDGTYTQAVKIRYDGNLGIGTTTPGAKLDVNGSIYSAGQIRANTLSLLMWGTDAGGTNRVLTGAPNVESQDSQGLELGTSSSAPVVLYTGASERLRIDASGNTSVTGNMTVSGTFAAKYQDVAEWVPSSEQLSAGTVVVLDSAKSNQVTSSSVSYDTRVAGVVSKQPGIALGEKSENKVLVATTGRVRVKVDASKGAIHIGDILVTSDIPGVAMKSEPVNLGGVQFHRPGTLIGKALEPLEKGKGEILVLLSLQ